MSEKFSCFHILTLLQEPLSYGNQAAQLHWSAKSFNHRWNWEGPISILSWGQHASGAASNVSFACVYNSQFWMFYVQMKLNFQTNKCFQIHSIIVGILSDHHSKMTLVAFVCFSACLCVCVCAKDKLDSVMLTEPLLTLTAGSILRSFPFCLIVHHQPFLLCAKWNH